MPLRLLSLAGVFLAALLTGCGATATRPSASAHATGTSPSGSPSATTSAGPTGTTPSQPARTGTAPARVTATVTAPARISTATITNPNSGGTGLTTAAPAGTPACVGADLHAAAVPPNGATGTILLGFTLTNVSAHPCVTYGWPGFSFLESAGVVAPTATTRSTRDILGPTPPRRFIIAPAAEASFRVTVHDTNAQGGEGGCRSYTGVQIIVPNDTAALVTAIPNGPVQSCGTVAVSPLEPGASATGQ
ncbi:DUF4232 domain-containing protein [Conexibacter sp. DBS9H8]|uniref:DUF4232 domain-containing protein n=1 Tax=Conexibacter sp. DBS9H8 TaxID=2937801 RepID=UPI0020101C7C|nr:DUF4232 domain-containing protein [Conexibacter sp. DBS9H8]